MSYDHRYRINRASWLGGREVTDRYVDRKQALHSLVSHASNVSLYVWIVVVSITGGLQAALPWLGSLYLREVLTAIVLFFFVAHPPSLKHRAILLLMYMFFVYTFVVVARSDTYSLVEQAKLFIRLIMFPLLTVSAIAFLSSMDRARRLFLSAFACLAILALSGALQLVIGAIPWLYPIDGLWLSAGRAGFGRYNSILGDANIGAIIGGLLPLAIIAFRGNSKHSKKSKFLVEVSIWTTSLTILASALSFTGTVAFICATVIVVWSNTKRRYQTLGRIALVLVCGIALNPEIVERIWGTLQFYVLGTSSVDRLPSVAAFQSTNLAGSDINFRLFAYLDVNDTLFKILLGSTYNTVVPNSYYNATGILAHNSIKELYLAGGMLALVIFGGLLGITGRKALRLVRQGDRDEFEGYGGTILAIVCCFLLLAAISLFFPVIHYNGVGVLFWLTIGLINFIHDDSFIT